MFSHPAPQSHVGVMCGDCPHQLRCGSSVSAPADADSGLPVLLGSTALPEWNRSSARQVETLFRQPVAGAFEVLAHPFARANLPPAAIPQMSVSS